MSVTIAKPRVNISVKDVQSVKWSKDRGEALRKLRYDRPRESCIRRMTEELGEDNAISFQLWVKLEKGGAKSVPIETLRKIAVGLGTPLGEVSLERLLKEVLAVD